MQVKALINIFLIFIYLAAFVPQTRVMIIDDQQDLREAICTLQILQAEIADEVKLSSTGILRNTIKSLQTLAILQGVMTTENTDNKQHVLIASKFRSPHLIPKDFAVLNPLAPHDISYTDEVTAYISVELKPEIPPPIFS